jgi:hypothetical protein
MQRLCSAALWTSVGSRSGIICCVESSQGFKSPILHMKQFAIARQWLNLLELGRHHIEPRTGGNALRFLEADPTF